jgi:hypothetical protein
MLIFILKKITCEGRTKTREGVWILKNHHSKRRKLWTKTGCSMQRECVDEDSSQ